MESGSTGWRGLHGGHCFQCDSCRRGNYILCRFQKITAISFDGGYADHMIAPQEALAAIPAYERMIAGKARFRVVLTIR